MNLVRFQILPPIENPGDPVFICGNHPALGDWDPARALPLQWHEPFQIGEVRVEPGTDLAYKILRGASWEHEASDATGRIAGDLEHTVDGDVLLAHTVADWRDRFCGRVLEYTAPSRILGEPREVCVWLPPGYALGNERYRIIVCSDGKNAFDPEASSGGVDLAIDEWVRTLIAEGLLPATIVAAVQHPVGTAEDGESLRDTELSPERQGALYSEFLVSELLPQLGDHFGITENPQHRILCGASLAALNAFYTAIHHPGVFGRFACLSTSFEDLSESLPSEAGQLAALRRVPALPPETRMAFCHGDQGLDECYTPYHAELAAILRQKGWHDGAEFVVREIPGAAHHEHSWRQRLGDALRFLVR